MNKNWQEIRKDSKNLMINQKFFRKKRPKWSQTSNI